MGDRLVEAARAAQQHAYCPYSHYRVGAALLTEDGRVFVGCNVENASYGLTVCAERSAVFTAVSSGARQFRRIVVATDSEPPAPPCGACRQVLAEFGAELEVESVGPTQTKRWRIGELLPDAFSKEILQ
ncbi:MAG TPA: cytidine deaminase [Gemmatimonadales bacterium]|nr:cytidine deaminase [Gemmatimonadales bacterium]